MIIYRILRVLLLPIYRIVYMRKVYGRENLPKEGNYIYACNHFGKIDTFVLADISKTKIYFMAKKEWFEHNFLRAKLFKFLGGVPVDREKADITSIKNCLKIIKDGNILAIFPEGTRNKVNSDLLPIKGGASMIAFMSGVKIVPVVMHKKFKPFRRNYLYIGKPFDYAEFKGQKLNSEVNEKLTEIMSDKMHESKDTLTQIVSEKKK